MMKEKHFTCCLLAGSSLRFWTNAPARIIEVHTSRLIPSRYRGARYSLCHAVIRSSSLPNSSPYNVLSVATEEWKLAYPLHYHGSHGRGCFNSFGMYQHGIPLGPKFIIPKEVSNHLRSCILKDCTTTILRRASLRVSPPSAIGHSWSRTIHHLYPRRPSIFLLDKLEKMCQIIIIHNRILLIIALELW
uniref:Uncharacterized protein n=1 Tax=Opuntia streptacantha TaxID=393608 RepID=A0A7C9AQV7_OPUST